MKVTMRRHAIAAGILVVTLLGIGLTVLIRPSPPAGNFPPDFSEAEKRQVVSTSRSFALSRSMVAVRSGHFAAAWDVLRKSRKWTVRRVGRLDEGRIVVDFGVDDPTTKNGYTVSSTYIFEREGGRWIVKRAQYH